LSVDARVQLTLEAYLYAMDNPVNGTDPSGATAVVGQEYRSAALQCRVDCGSGWGWLADAVRWVYHNTPILSDITTALAAVAYITCAATAGIGCAVGLTLSEISTGLDAIGVLRGCSEHKGGCPSAVASFALDVATDGAGAGARRLMAASLNMENEYSKDVYLARQHGVTGAAASILGELYQGAKNVYDKLASR
jgi:hypothetical protein